MATVHAPRERSGYAASRAPLFSDLGWRAAVAALLPFLLATVGSNALTLLLLPGADGFFVTVTLLWTVLWVMAFFHAMFDSSLPRVLWVQGAMVVAASLPLAPAVMNVVAA